MDGNKSSPLQQKVHQSPIYFDRDSATQAKIVRVAHNTKVLMDVMLCSRCDGLPIPPRVAACTEGHLMCGSCIRLIDPYVRCHKEIGSTDSSTTMECGESIHRYSSQIYSYLYNNSLFRCPNAVHGCKKTFLGSNLKKHERTCTYCPTLVCPFTSCHFGLLPPPNYVEHLITIHHVVMFMSNSSRVQVLDDPTNNDIPPDTPHYRWLCAIVTCFGLTFMLMAEEDNGSLFIWISLASDENLVKGRKYQCTLTMVPVESLSSKGLSWTGDVYPSEKSFDDIVTKEDSLLITRASLNKRYIVKGTSLSIWNIDVVIKERPVSSDTVQGLAPENGVLEHGISSKQIHENGFGQPPSPCTSTFFSAENSQRLSKSKSPIQHLKDTEDSVLDPHVEETLEPVPSVKKSAEADFSKSVPDLPSRPIIEVIVNVSPNPDPNPPICPDSDNQNDREEVYSMYSSPLFTPPTEPKDDPMKKDGFKTQTVPKPKPKKPIPRARTIFPDGRRNVKPNMQLVEIRSTWENALDVEALRQRILENREKARMKANPIVKEYLRYKPGMVTSRLDDFD